MPWPVSRPVSAAALRATPSERVQKLALPLRPIIKPPEEVEEEEEVEEQPSEEKEDRTEPDVGEDGHNHDNRSNKATAQNKNLRFSEPREEESKEES